MTSPRATARPLSMNGEGGFVCRHVAIYLSAWREPLAIHGEGRRGSAG